MSTALERLTPKVPRGYYRTCRKCGAQMVQEFLDVHRQLAHEDDR